MYKYRVFMYWSEDDGCYVTEVPELAGCMADGKTQDEALKNTQEVIKVWIETAKADGEEIPQPQYYSIASL